MMKTLFLLAALTLVACGGDQKPAASPDPNTTGSSSADPTKDTDGDGVPDHQDKCPDKKEDGQGTDPKDGCPNADATKK